MSDNEDPVCIECGNDDSEMMHFGMCAFCGGEIVDRGEAEDE